MKNFKLGSSIVLVVLALNLIVFPGLAQAVVNHNIAIKQITPKGGFSSARVIAYGHYIKPPYKLQITNNVVYLNNVQMYPKLKYLYKQIEKTSEEKLFDTTIDNARKMFNELIASNKDTNMVMDSIVSFVKSKKIVDAILFHNNNGFKYTLTTGKSKLQETAFCKINFTEKFSKDISVLNNVQKINNVSNLLKRDLSANIVLIWTTDEYRTMNIKIFDEIKAIMQNGNDTIQKDKQLANLGLSPNFIKDLLNNYTEEEWR